jgi:hypothetical protein
MFLFLNVAKNLSVHSLFWFDTMIMLDLLESTYTYEDFHVYSCQRETQNQNISLHIRESTHAKTPSKTR